MTSLTQEITLKTTALPESMQYEVLNFISFLYAKWAKSQLDETALLSEKTLATDWNREEEDEAWIKFQ